MAAARDFDELSGFGTILLGGLCAIQAISPSDGLLWILAPLGWGLVMAAVRRRWFQPRFGTRVPSSTSSGLEWFVLAVFFTGALVLVHVDHTHPGGVALTPLWLAAGLAVQWATGLRHVGIRWWHCLTVAAIGLTSIARPLHLPGGGRSFMAVAGVAMVLVGALDLWRLTRILPAVPHD